MRTTTVLVISLLALGACKKQAPPPEPVVEAPPPPPEPEQTEEEAVAEMVRNFQKVHFEFDQATLADASKAALQANAEIMQKHVGLRVEIQGHADERGTTEYNLALGQKRATAIRDHMSSMGVAPSRLTIVSYGEERPAVSGSGESAWSENRRAEFRVLAGDAPVQGTVQ